MADKRCDAIDCNESISAAKLMCTRHYMMLPSELKYQLAQKRTMRRGPLSALDIECIKLVARLEGKS
jgi:hypothetical protein